MLIKDHMEFNFPAILLVCVQPAMDLIKLNQYGYGDTVYYLMGRR